MYCRQNRNEENRIKWTARATGFRRSPVTPEKNFRGSDSNAARFVKTSCILAPDSCVLRFDLVELVPVNTYRHTHQSVSFHLPHVNYGSRVSEYANGNA